MSVYDDQMSAMQNRLSNFQGISAPKAASYAYTPKDYSGSLPQYDTIRQTATQQLNNQNSQAQDAMQRRFAAMGNLNSGAYTHAAQMQDQSHAEGEQNAMNQIGQEEAQTRIGLEQGEQGRALQAGEAQAGREQQANIAGTQVQEYNQQTPFQMEGELAKMDLQNQDNQFNKAQQRFKAKNSGGLLGGGGFLGTGIDTQDPGF